MQIQREEQRVKGVIHRRIKAGTINTYVRRAKLCGRENVTNY